MAEGPSPRLTLDGLALHDSSLPPALSHAQLPVSSPGPCTPWVLQKAVVCVCSTERLRPREAGLSLGNLGQQLREMKVKGEASQVGTTQPPCPETSSH